MTSCEHPSDPEALGDALCLILNDRDTARQAAALAPFLRNRPTAGVFRGPPR